MSRIFFSLFLLFIFVSFSNAQIWETFSFTDAGGIYCASSELNKPDNFSVGKYSPRNLLDRDPRTAWVEGENGSGEGTAVCLAMGDTLKKFFTIANGFQKSHILFLKNNRIKTLKITLYLGFTDDTKVTQAGFHSEAVAYPVSKTVALQDTEGYQTFPLSFDGQKVSLFRDKMVKKYILLHQNSLREGKAYGTLRDFFFIKFEIKEVIRGSKWDDTCISDLLLTNKKPPSFIPANEQILTVLESDNGGAIYVRTVSGKTYNLLSVSNDEVRNGKVLSVASLSPDKQWVIIDIMEGGAGRGTEESYRLYYLPLIIPLSSSLIDAYNLGEPLDFEEKDGKLTVVFFNGEKAADEILEDMKITGDSFAFHEDAQEALALLFAKAVSTRDIPGILFFMDERNKKELLVQKMNHDTTAYLTAQFSGPVIKGSGNAAILPYNITQVSDPVLQPEENSWSLILKISDGRKTIRCSWLLVKGESEGGSVVALWGPQ